MVMPRLAVVALAAGLALAVAPRASACSCGSGSDDLRENLRTARERAVAIYRARVDDADDTVFFEGKATVEVLEVFKGDVKPGDHLRLPHGGGGDCSIHFTAKTEYLMYARGDGPTAVYHCSRTRPVAAGDSELKWLRTGEMPPVPVALQRESVTCDACDAFTVGERLVTAPGAKPCGSMWQNKAEAAMKAGEPFFTNAEDSDRAHHVMVGMSRDGKAFEVTATPNVSVDDRCVQKVQLRWCKRLDVTTHEPPRYPDFRCVEPGEATLQCDETKSRKASWDPPEQLQQGGACSWYSPTDPICYLNAARKPLPEGAPQYPLLRCLPGHGSPGDKRHLCHVEVAPPAHP